jgi:ubiquinone/menaquinone biosynthesis C-methylase UbiE
VYDDELRSRRYYEGRARWYDWANRVAALLRGTSGMRERRKAIAHLRLKDGQRVLEVSVGTGTNLPLMREVMASGALVGVDISRAMLRRCQEKLRDHHVDAVLVESDAAHLPFDRATFDAVFHHGGIAEFGDRGAAIGEMVRVAKAGARIVICDVGLPRDRELSLTSRLLLRTQPAYMQPPPDDVLPEEVSDVRLSWFGGGAWYLIECTKRSVPVGQ